MLLFTCICGLMMNDVLYIETSATVSASVISNEDTVKNNVFGIVTLVLNIVALTFIIFTVLPEYRVIKRVISLIQKVCPCSLSPAAANLRCRAVSSSRRAPQPPSSAKEIPWPVSGPLT